MIIKIHRAGRSFAGITNYLTRNKESKEIAERVAWTATLNLADDHVPTAVHEMLWTYRAADQLKRAAGISTGGSKLQRPVKHFTIGWHESEQPTKEHMLETVKEYLKHMKWDDRQAILVAHSDKAHSHVHVVLNVVSPEDGRALKDSHERLRTEDFCLAYERTHGKIFCEQRLMPREDRTPTPTRETWRQLREFEKQDDRAELARERPTPTYEQRTTNWKTHEWWLLKNYQREQRVQFMTGGKAVYREARNQAYREIRAEFRNEWKSFHARRRAGMDKELLSEWKEKIIADQKEQLTQRKAEYGGAAKEKRDDEYTQLRKRQETEKQELKTRQGQGLRSFALLEAAHPRRPAVEPDMERVPIENSFRQAANEHTVREKTAPTRHHQPRDPAHNTTRPPLTQKLRVRDPVDAVGGFGLGALGGIAEIGERLFDGFFGGTPAPKEQQKEVEPNFEAERKEKALDAVTAQRQAEAREAEARKESEWFDQRRRGNERD
jgi:hypothetical protein